MQPFTSKFMWHALNYMYNLFVLTRVDFPFMSYCLCHLGGHIQNNHDINQHHPVALTIWWMGLPLDCSSAA